MISEDNLDLTASLARLRDLYAELGRVREVIDIHRRNETRLVNDINEAQRMVDRALLQAKQEAARGTDWLAMAVRNAL